MISIVSHQMLIMGIYFILGIILYKGKIISKEGSKTLSSLLIYLITPVSIVRSFCIPFTADKFNQFLICFVMCALVQSIGIVVSHIFFKNKPVEEYATSYANTGFFGIPVIQACLGTEAVFYIAPLVVFTGALQHTYGAKLLLNTSRIDIKRIIFAPNVIGLVVGLVIFVSGLGTHIPAIFNQCIDAIANMNAFFAMTILGVFFAQSDLTLLYKKGTLYLISLLRLLVIPLLCAFVFRFIPVDYTIKLAILLSFAGPVGSNIANYSLLFNKDYGTACLYVAISTVFCIGTLPLFTKLAEVIL